MDETLDPEKELEGVEEDEVDDDDALLGLIPKKGKVTKDDDEDSMDALADEEDILLPEDKFDDEDFW